jgi:hypothetical protein
METRLDQQTFKAYMKVLEEHFNHKVSDETRLITRRAYWEVLKSCTPEEFEAGVCSAIASLNFFPSASRLKELCYGGKTEEQRAFEKNFAPKDAPQLESVEQKHPEIIEQNRDSLNLLWKYNSFLQQLGHSQQDVISMAKNGSIRDVLRGYFEKPDDYSGCLLLDSDSERELQKLPDSAFKINREQALKLIEKWKEDSAS